MQVRVRPRARRDIQESTRYLNETAGDQISERFLDGLRKSFDTLVRMPLAGLLCGFTKPVLRDLRRWPVHGFDSWLIFYRPTIDDIEVVRVLHGARDISSILS